MVHTPCRQLPVDQWPPSLHGKNVRINMKKELFVGSFTKATLQLSKITMDDLNFRIPAGAKGGIISPCKDAEFNAEKPDIMVCTGHTPGKYELQVVHRTTDIVMATHEFTVTTKWRNPKLGPGISFTGIMDQFTPSPAFGGGDPGPDNWHVQPATGTRGIAIIMVDFPDGLYPTDATQLQDIKDRWMNEIINGVNFNGRDVSTKKYYQEVSNGVFDISADIFGPFHLADNWDTYFSADGAPLGTIAQAAVTAADASVDFRNYQSILILSQTASNNRNAWPYGFGAALTTSEGDISRAIMSMPHEWGAGFRANRNVHATVAHELGHNLGLGDQYTPGTNRNTGSWELMNSEDDMPHFTAFHRLYLGWIKEKSWVKPYNFVLGGVPVNETQTLSPIELGAPPAGQFALIEVRVATGWNYYVEYRSPQTTQVGDHALPTPNALLVTDVDATPGDAPISRPQILLVPNDPDGDGSVLINGRDYRETDNSDPTFPTDFRLSASGIDGTKADITIQYGVNSRPDPAIRPWPAASDRPWQSPDIEVRNAKSLADPVWANVPWSGHDNTIVAKIRNNGDLAAPGVTVDFYVKNFNVGGAPEVRLGDDTRDIPARGMVEFTSNWLAPAEGHFCVIVRIRPYAVPGTFPAVLEMSPSNNLAQSNYDRFISASSSAATREIAAVEVGNPFKLPTRVYILPGQSNPLYRTYLEHTTLWLEPGETRSVKVMHEYDPTNLRKCPIALGKGNGSFVASRGYNNSKNYGPAGLVEKFSPLPNKASFVAYIVDPRNNKDKPIGTTILGGAQTEVVTGKKTKFESFYEDKPKDCEVRFHGRVVVDSLAKESEGVSGGKVVIAYTNGEDEKACKRSYTTVKVDLEGRFIAESDGGARKIKASFAAAYYVPDPGYADCWSPRLALEHY